MNVTESSSTTVPGTHRPPQAEPTDPDAPSPALQAVIAIVVLGLLVGSGFLATAWVGSLVYGWIGEAQHWIGSCMREIAAMGCCS